MWTPKRLLILLGGALLFLSAYGVYSYFLGIYNGYPRLPERFLAQSEIPTQVPIDGTAVDAKLVEAFGAECEELRYPFRLSLQSRGLAFATKHFDIEPDGRVKLSPFSGCMFPKGKDNGKFPEINTVRCNVAFITLDRKVKNLSEMSNRRIVGVELRSEEGVTIVNNRRTPQKFDDIELRITNGPLFFDEERRLIWSDGIVQLLDMQTQPNPTSIKARGMELQLAKDTPLAKTASRSKTAKRGDAINGVKKLILRSDVDMHLYVDPSSGFLANSKDFAKGPTAPGTPQQKSHIVIQTNGPFTYDLTKEMARFEIPPPNPSATPTLPEKVIVTREFRQGDSLKLDQLYCDFLEMHFREKTVSQRGVRNNHQSINKEIESALATAEPGKVVQLNMETENLKAFGTELSYRCPSPGQGPKTVLKGQPMHAFKEGHKIRALELHLIGADKAGQGQQVFARGPGQIDLFDKSNAERPYTLHAIWRDTLTSTRIVQDDRTMDLLTLTGDASFIDEVHGQELAAQKLQVWLEQGEAPTTSAAVTTGSSPPVSATAIDAPPTPAKGPTTAVTDKKAQPAGKGSGQRPRRLEAFNKVFAFSPDLIVKNAKHLIVHFKDDSPSALPALVKGTLTSNSKEAKDPGTGQPVAAQNTEPNGKNLLEPGSRNGSRKPIELEASEVTAYVRRVGSKHDLDELVTEGNVHVVQEGSDKDKKGIDIRGEMLNLIHHLKGDILYVFGEPRRPAELRMGELVLIGPKVTINQRENIAEVEGTGTMHMPSNTSLDGGKPAKKDSRLTVHWNKDMLFNGKFAEFNGGVQAFQDEGALKCQNLQVILDQQVSFKEGQKDKQNAKVERIVCHRNVVILESVREKDGKLVIRERRGEFSQLSMDNRDGPMIGTGPGYVQEYGAGAGNLQGPITGPGRVEQPSREDQAKEPKSRMTRIEFEGRLFSNNKDKTRTSKFYDNIQVFHFPTDQPNPTIHRDKVPKNGFYLRCDLLTVYSKAAEKGSTQLILAERKVTFQTEEFFGRADVVKYDESLDHVIFEAAPGSTVTIIKTVGGQQQQIRGKKILYRRQTGEFLLDGVKSIQSRLPTPVDPRTDRDQALLMTPRLYQTAMMVHPFSQPTRRAN